MITVDEAYELIGRHVQPLPAAKAFFREALGLRLAEPVVSEVDSPPFDKSMFDGYAIAVNDPSPTRRIIEQVVAGGVPHRAIEPGVTIQIMTGAPIPDGANAVVKHEDTERLDEHTVRLPEGPITEGTGIVPRGSSFRVGDEIVAAGKKLRAVDLALMAEVGKSAVMTIPRPRIAVLSTGNELVEANQPLAAGQIRNSNGPMLVAVITEAGATPVDLGIVRDEVDQLRAAISRGLESDMLLISGGVSAGVMDLVPAVLAELGVEQVFHKIRMKPGKPLWFGTRDAGTHHTLVFGLPGNPVSTLVGFYLFVKPAIEGLAGGKFTQATPIRGQLSTGTAHRGNRPTYHPCRLQRNAHGQVAVEPLPWRGSADLAALANADGLLLLPSGDYELAVGTSVEVIGS